MSGRDFDRPQNHWDEDDLDDGPKPSHGGVFEDNAQIHGSDDLLLSQGPAVLPVNALWPDVSPVGGKTLIDISFKDQKPRVVTVTLGSIGTYIGMWGVGMPRAEVVGVMEIGIGGMMFTAEVDFMEGVQFSLAVSKFKLSAVFRTLPGETAPIITPIPQIKVGASAALGVVAHGRAPQRSLTRANWALGLAISEFWNLPHFAKTMRVLLRTPGFAPVLDTTLIDTGGAGSASYATAAPGGPEYAIEGGALGIQVADIGAVPTSQYSLVFELAL